MLQHCPLEKHLKLYILHPTYLIDHVMKMEWDANTNSSHIYSLAQSILLSLVDEL